MSFCKVEDADTLVGSGGVTLPPTNITATCIKYRIDAECFSKIERAHLRMQFRLLDEEKCLIFHENYYDLPRKLDGKQILQFLFYAHLPRAGKEQGSSRSLIYLFGFDHESGREEFMIKHEDHIGAELVPAGEHDSLSSSVGGWCYKLITLHIHSS